MPIKGGPGLKEVAIKLIHSRSGAEYCPGGDREAPYVDKLWFYAGRKVEHK